MNWEVRIAGFGGQGVGLAGYLLGKAITIYGGRQAIMTQSYGPEARGGASSADLVVSDQPIDYPFVHQPDLLVTLSQEAYTRFRPTIKHNGLVLVDEELVHCPSDPQHRRIPATRLAKDLGLRIVANVVMLGFLTSVTDLVSQDALIKSIETTVKPKSLALNVRAFKVGLDYVNQEVSLL